MKFKLKLKLTIGRKIGYGFGIVTIAMLASSVLTYITLNNNRSLNEKITNEYSPSVSSLNEMYNLVSNSKMLIKNWVFIEMKSDTPDKIKLKDMHAKDFPNVKNQLDSISKTWNDSLRAHLDSIIVCVEDTLFAMHKDIMGQLSTFDSYSDPMITMMVNMKVEQGGEVIEYTNKLLECIESIQKEFTALEEKARLNMLDSFDSFQFFIIIMGIVLIAIALIISIVTIQTITRPVNYLKNILLAMKRGLLPDNKLKETNDEIGEMAQALNQFIEALRKTADFSLEIGKGNFESDFEPLSDEDSLGQSLVVMRNNLKDASEEEAKRKEEDKQRSWATQGLAKFGDLLRQNNDNMEELSYNIISNLVKYLDANQGGMFIVDEDADKNKKIELVAAFAYNRRKYLEKEISVGEGLVGTCVQEGQIIYMNDVPNDYINITSGLGGANPKSILIVPLKLNDEIYGVLEMASFKEFEQYQREFVQDVAESIASTISSVKINIQTAKLLKESQEQAEKMAQQEEEMRQNMEEMQATQEEAARKEAEMAGVVQAINNASYLIELSPAGNIIKGNKKVEDTLQMSSEQLINKPINTVIKYQKDIIAGWNDFWQEIMNGTSKSQDAEIALHDGSRKYLKEVYTPIFNNNGEISKVLLIAADVTDGKNYELELMQQQEELISKEEELRQNMEEIKTISEEIEKKNAEMNGVLNAVNTSSLVVIFDMEGKIIDINDEFVQLFDMTKDDMLGQNHNQFSEMAKDEEKYNQFWENIKAGKVQKVTEHIKLPNGKEYWLYEVYSAIFDNNGNPEKVMNIAMDITENRKQRIALQEQKDKVERLMAQHKNEMDDLKSELEMVNAQLIRKDKKITKLQEKQDNNE